MAKHEHFLMQEVEFYISIPKLLKSENQMNLLKETQTKLAAIKLTRA